MNEDGFLQVQVDGAEVVIANLNVDGEISNCSSTDYPCDTERMLSTCALRGPTKIPEIENPPFGAVTGTYTVNERAYVRPPCTIGLHVLLPLATFFQDPEKHFDDMTEMKVMNEAEILRNLQHVYEDNWPFVSCSRV